MGWYGEDCDGENFDGIDVCHSVPADGHLELTKVAMPDDVADGKSLFGAATAPGLTYILIRNSLKFEGCWTWGEDVEYFGDQGCDPLTP